MTPTYWAILIAIAIAAVGLVFGVAGIFLAPLIGVLAVVALIVWAAQRKAQHKPPLE